MHLVVHTNQGKADPLILHSVPGRLRIESGAGFTIVNPADGVRSGDGNGPSSQTWLAHPTQKYEACQKIDKEIVRMLTRGHRNTILLLCVPAARVVITFGDGSPVYEESPPHRSIIGQGIPIVKGYRNRIQWHGLNSHVLRCRMESEGGLPPRLGTGSNAEKVSVGTKYSDLLG